MSDAGNTLGDFPAAAFTIIAFCNVRRQSGPRDRSTVPERVRIRTLPARLRCSACGAREASIHILYTGAGGYHSSVVSPTP